MGLAMAEVVRLPPLGLPSAREKVEHSQIVSTTPSCAVQDAHSVVLSIELNVGVPKAVSRGQRTRAMPRSTNTTTVGQGHSPIKGQDDVHEAVSSCKNQPPGAPRPPDSPTSSKGMPQACGRGARRLQSPSAPVAVVTPPNSSSGSGCLKSSESDTPSSTPGKKKSVSWCDPEATAFDDPPAPAQEMGNRSLSVPAQEVSVPICGVSAQEMGNRSLAVPAQEVINRNWGLCPQMIGSRGAETQFGKPEATLEPARPIAEPVKPRGARPILSREMGLRAPICMLTSVSNPILDDMCSQHFTRR